MGHQRIVQRTVLVADIATEGSSSPRNLTVFDGLMYFSASKDGSGRELWVTNGSYWGTGLVSDIRPGTFGSNPKRPDSRWGNTVFHSTGQ